MYRSRDVRCPSCHSYAPHDLEECEKKSKFDIELYIEAERRSGPFDPSDMRTSEGFLGIVAGKLMKKWFGE